MQNFEFLRISYTAKIKETGQEFDKSEDSPVILGAGYLIKGLEEALKGMKEGEERTIEIPPEKGFGKRDPNLIKLVSESEFKRHGTKPSPGMIVQADNLRGKVLSVSSGRVRVDFNHPLAGKTLIYNVKIKKKLEEIEDKVKAIVEVYTRIKKGKVKVIEKEVEIEIPPLINPVFKKKIADEIMRLLGFEKIRFIEVFEKPKKE